MAFDHKRDTVTDPEFALDVERLKNSINYSTYTGAQIDSGGYILQAATPVSDYVTRSVLCILRDPITYLSDEVPLSKYDLTETENPYKDSW